MAFGMFVRTVYLPFYGRKWKRSTMMSNHDRLERYLVLEFGARKLGSFRREELQDFLDRREADGLSYSTVAHLRWDMRQIFRMAVAEGFIQRNPADLLATRRIEELMLELKARYTIAIVTDNLQQAQRVADKAGFLYVDTVARTCRTTVL
jgi:site-specific recombinase XerD